MRNRLCTDFFSFPRIPLNLRWPFHERWRRWKSQMFSQTNTRIHLPANRLVGGLPCRISLFSFSSLSLLTLSLVLSFCLVSCTLHTRWSHHLYMRGGLWRNEKKKKATRSQSRFCYGSERAETTQGEKRRSKKSLISLEQTKHIFTLCTFSLWHDHMDLLFCLCFVLSQVQRYSVDLVFICLVIKYICGKFYAYAHVRSE